MDNMLKKYSEKIKLINKFIWNLAELGIAVAISGLVLFLLLGESSGVFPMSVTDNFILISNGLGPKGISAI